MNIDFPKKKVVEIWVYVDFLLYTLTISIIILLDCNPNLNLLSFLEVKINGFHQNKDIWFIFSNIPAPPPNPCCPFLFPLFLGLPFHVSRYSWKCESVSHSVISDSLWPRRLWFARLLCPLNSPGKNTGVDILQGIFLTQSLNLGLLRCKQILVWASRGVLVPHC